MGKGAMWRRGNTGSVCWHYTIPKGWNSGFVENLGEIVLLVMFDS